MNAIATPLPRDDGGLAPLVPLCIAVLFGFLPLGVALGALPLHLSRTLGAGDIAVGLIIAAQSLATLLSRQFAGRLADANGGRWAMVTGLVVMLAAGLVQVLCALPADAATQLATLVAARLVLGIGESFVMTGGLGWGLRRFGPARAGRVMVWCGISMYAAFSLGAPLGGWMLREHGFLGVAIVAGLAPLVSLLATAALAPVAPAGGERLPFHRVIGLVARCGTGLALASLAFGAMATFVSLMFAARGWGDSTWSMTLFGAGYIGLRLIGSAWPDRYGGARVALASLAVEIVGQGLLGAAHDAWLAHLGAVLTGAGFSLVFPSFGVEAVKRAPPASRASAMGAYVAFFDIALIVCGPVNGLVAARFGYAAVFVAGAVAAAGAAVVAFSLLRKPFTLAA